MFTEGSNMKVILTTDGSIASENAIKWFCQLPLHDHQNYPVVTVSNHFVYGMTTRELHDELCRLEKIESGENFKRAAKIVNGCGLEALHVELTGQAADQITQYAQESAADLIVVSAHGSSRLERVLLGSTSESIAAHAHCAVLVVRGADQTTNQNSRSIHVVLASDGSENVSETAFYLRGLGLPINTKLSLITIIEHPTLLDPKMQYDQQITDLAQSKLDSLSEQLRSTFPLVETKVIEKIHVGEAIVHFLVESQADIVIVRDKGRSAISRFFLGSVSRFVLHRALCSVLVLRNRKE